MAKRIQYGNLFVDVPDDHVISKISTEGAPETIKNEKPDVPEKIEVKIQTYNLSDPFQAAVGNVHALSNVQKTDKPWVKITFLIFFILIPFIKMELIIIETIENKREIDDWLLFIALHTISLAFIGFYFLIWLKSNKIKNKAQPNPSINRDG